MKIKILLIIVLCLECLVSVSFAQISGTPEQNCLGAIPVCHNIYSQTSSYSTSGTDTELTTVMCPPTGPNGNNGALASGEKNSVWYVVNVVSNGLFAFDIFPNVPTEDYDFAVWNITGGGCSLIYDYVNRHPNYYPPVGGSCFPPNNGASNYAPNLGILGQTGLSRQPALIANGQFDSSFYVFAGETYVICISNFSSSTNGYTLDFGESTAGLYDTVKPLFASASSLCNISSDHIHVNMSVPITCASLAPDGSDFYFTPPVAGITVTGASNPICSIVGALSIPGFDVQFSAILPPGTYWLHSQIGNDTNTLVDVCTNEQRVNDSVEFIMLPQVPPVIAQGDTPACYKLRLIFDRPVKCSSVDLDGSDFTVTGPATVQVIRAIPVGCNTTTNLVDTLDLFFDSSISAPGMYTLNFNKGSDNSYIQDTCGAIVVSPFSWYVSDTGLKTNASPDTLCSPGYVYLTSAINGILPPGTLICGANNTPCTGSSFTYQIGNDNSLMTTNSPLDNSSRDSRMQMLYTAKKLKAAGFVSGTINSLALAVVSKRSSKPYNNFTIKMTCTKDTVLDTSNALLNSFVSGLPIVFGPKDIKTTSGWNTFNLDNTYDWDSTNNLLIEICYHLDSAGTATDYILGTTDSNVAVYNRFTNFIQGCALPSKGGAVSTLLPDIRFTYCQAVPGFRFLWTNKTYLDDDTSFNNRAFVRSNSSYTISTHDLINCIERGTANIIVSQRNPAISPLDTAICLGTKISIHASGGNTYLWFPDFGLSCNACADPIVSLDTPGLTYNVGIYDQLGCGDTLTNRVRVNALPVVNVSYHDTTILYGKRLQLFASAPAAIQFMWNPTVGLDYSWSSNPSLFGDTTIRYVVTIIDTNGCQNSDSLTIHVIEQEVHIPSVFSPNNDGKNDRFRVANLTTQKVIEFKVFNRWGQQIYEESGNSGWDGTFNGIPQDIAVYSYLIRVAFHDGHLETFKGGVTLLR